MINSSIDFMALRVGVGGLKS